MQEGSWLLNAHWVLHVLLHRKQCLIARKKASWPESRMLSWSSPHPIIGKKETLRLHVVRHPRGGDMWQLKQMDGGFPGGVWKLMSSQCYQDEQVSNQGCW